MYQNQTCAAKGADYGSRQKQMLYRSLQRAAVSIYKTENAYEMLVFAPGRIKENFHLDVKGNEITISYTPPEGFSRPEWILREYSRGGFVRTFTLDGTMDAQNISAKYVDGVLQVTIPMVPEKEQPKKAIVVQ